ncbi:MAG TPA: hypothetical protein VGJ07_23135 [Rugosimonospora sp.]
MSGEAAPKRPLYARVLRLRYMHPGGLLCFAFFEGMILLAILLALAELVTWWVVIILPATVAAMVKVNDVIAGLSFPGSGRKAGLPRWAPAVARGSAVVDPSGHAAGSQQTGRVVGRVVGRAVGTASAPGASGASPSPYAGRSAHPGANPGVPDAGRGGNGGPGRPSQPGNGVPGGLGDLDASAAAGGPAGDQHGGAPGSGDPGGDLGADLGAGLPLRRTAWPNQRRFERPV